MKYLAIPLVLLLASCSESTYHQCKPYEDSERTFTFEVREDGSVRNMYIDNRLQLTTMIKAFWRNLDEVEEGCVGLEEVDKSDLHPAIL